MKRIELMGYINEQRQLHVDLPADIQPGPVKITLQTPTEAEEANAWRALINHTWAADWSDPREDIYTLEDGKPSHVK